MNLYSILHQIIVPLNTTKEDIVCVYWDYNESTWLDDGCFLIASLTDNYTATCECNHLTDFSILMSVVSPVSF